MDYVFTFYLPNTQSSVDITAKDLESAAARCRELYCTQSIALSSVNLP